MVLDWRWARRLTRKAKRAATSLQLLRPLLLVLRALATTSRQLAGAVVLSDPIGTDQLS